MNRFWFYPELGFLCHCLTLSDIFVAIPGGIGTLDEIFTIAVAHTISYHHKMVILYNMKGFWNSTSPCWMTWQRKA